MKRRWTLVPEDNEMDSGGLLGRPSLSKVKSSSQRRSLPQPAWSPGNATISDSLLQQQWSRLGDGFLPDRRLDQQENVGRSQPKPRCGSQSELQLQPGPGERQLREVQQEKRKQRLQELQARYEELKRLQLSQDSQQAELEHLKQRPQEEKFAKKISTESFAVKQSTKPRQILQTNEDMARSQRLDQINASSSAIEQKGEHSVCVSSSTAQRLRSTSANNSAEKQPRQVSQQNVKPIKSVQQLLIPERTSKEAAAIRQNHYPLSFGHRIQDRPHFPPVAVVVPPHSPLISPSTVTSSASGRRSHPVSKRQRCGQRLLQRSRATLNYLAVASVEDDAELALTVDPLSSASQSPSSSSPGSPEKAHFLSPKISSLESIPTTEAATTPDRRKAACKPRLSPHSNLIIESPTSSSLTNLSSPASAASAVAIGCHKKVPRNRLRLMIEDDEQDAGNCAEGNAFDASCLLDSGGQRRGRASVCAGSGGTLADRAVRLARLRIGDAHMWRHTVEAAADKQSEDAGSNKLSRFVRLRVCHSSSDHSMQHLECLVLEDHDHLLLSARPSVCHVFLPTRSGPPLASELCRNFSAGVEILVAQPFRLLPSPSTSSNEVCCLTDVRRYLVTSARGGGSSEISLPADSTEGAKTSLPDDWLPVECCFQDDLPADPSSPVAPPAPSAVRQQLFDSSDAQRHVFRTLALSLAKYTFWPGEGRPLTHRLLALSPTAAFLWLRVRAADCRELPLGCVLSVNCREAPVEMSEEKPVCAADRDSSETAQQQRQLVKRQFDLCRQMQRALATNCQLQLAQFLQCSWQRLVLESADCRYGRVCVYSPRQLLKPPGLQVYTVGFSAPSPIRVRLYGLLLRVAFDQPMRLYLYSAHSKQVVCARSADTFYLPCEAVEGSLVDIADCLVVKGALWCDAFTTVAIVSVEDTDMSAFEYVIPVSESDCRIGQLLEFPACQVTRVHTEDAYAWPVCPICFACQLGPPQQPDSHQVCGRCGHTCTQPELTRHLEVTVKWCSADNLEFRLLLHSSTASTLVESAGGNPNSLIGCELLANRLAFVSRRLADGCYRVIEACIKFPGISGAAAF